MNHNIFTIVVLVLYFVPTGLALPSRRASVFVLNLFFGWTIIGWIFALFLALRSREDRKAGA